MNTSNDGVSSIQKALLIEVDDIEAHLKNLGATCPLCKANDWLVYADTKKEIPAEPPHAPLWVTKPVVDSLDESEMSIEAGNRYAPPTFQCICCTCSNVITLDAVMLANIISDRKVDGNG